jgi:hypothetical protein
MKISAGAASLSTFGRTKQRTTGRTTRKRQPSPTGSQMDAQGQRWRTTRTLEEVASAFQADASGYAQPGGSQAEWSEVCEDAGPREVQGRLWNALLECARLRQSSAPPATPLPHARPKRSRKRLRTPSQIVREIRDTISDLSSGQIDSATARTKLYALQTLLVAMKMAESMPENTPKLQRRGPQLSLPAPPDEE